LWRARQRIKDDDKFTKLVVSIMNDKEYDKAKTL
jgi:hypothetical protein